MIGSAATVVLVGRAPTQTGELPPDELARFHTRSGLLTAARRGDDRWS